MSAEVSKFPGDADGFAESVQMSTVWLQLAQDRGSWRQFAKFGKSPVFGVANADAKQRYTRCLVDPRASGMHVEHSLLMVWAGADWRRMVVAAPKDNDREREKESESLLVLAGC